MQNKPIDQVIRLIEAYDIEGPSSITSCSQLIALVKDYGLFGAIDYLDPNKVVRSCAYRDAALVDQHYRILCRIAGTAVWCWSDDLMAWILDSGESDGVLPDRAPQNGKNWCVINGSRIMYVA